MFFYMYMCVCMYIEVDREVRIHALADSRLFDLPRPTARESAVRRDGPAELSGPLCDRAGLLFDRPGRFLAAQACVFCRTG